MSNTFVLACFWCLLVRVGARCKLVASIVAIIRVRSGIVTSLLFQCRGTLCSCFVVLVVVELLFLLLFLLLLLLWLLFCVVAVCYVRVRCLTLVVDFVGHTDHGSER